VPRASSVGSHGGQPNGGALKDAVRRAASIARRAVPVSRARYDALARRHQQAVLDGDRAGGWMPPGHFYSPFPDLGEVERRSATIFDTGRDPTGLDMHEPDQVALFDTLAGILDEGLPFPEHAGTADLRFHFENPAYSWSDALVLHAMLRHIRPGRVVEVGSGYSSAMLLDTAERWLDSLDGGVELVFVEPYTELLTSLLRPGDEDRVTIVEAGVQDAPLDVFDRLGAGDVLFVDSTHVVKAGSDVNHLLFEVFPRLRAGVWIHVHDIFFPFEYPMDWVREGRAWHEAYLLRALLTGNDAFEIRWFQSFMWARHRALLEGRVPDMARNPGANLWLQKVR
jgi:hypothetical protein